MAGSSLRKRASARSRSVVESTSSKVQRLLSWHELPAWMQDNEYILSGYRKQSNSVVECINSIFAYVHNETVNIHSHLWAALLFIIFLSTLTTHLAAYPTATLIDTVGYAIFLTSAVACLSFSAIYHAFKCHSEEFDIWWSKMDYTGITVLVVGTHIPGLYYTFYCNPLFQAFYIIEMIIAGACASYVVLSPKYAGSSHRGARVLVFITLGLCGFVPMTHAFFLHGFHNCRNDLGYNWFLAGHVTYVLGGFIYANRFPERRWPGHFDKLGSSHQIFHLHVVVAALMHWRAIQTGAHHWLGVMQATCPVA